MLRRLTAMLLLALATGALAGDVASPPGLPQGAVAIIRSGTAAGTLYTVGAGRKLHVTHAWVSVGGSTTAGSATLTADVYKDATRTILGEVNPAGAAAGGGSAALDGCDVHVGPTGTVVIVATGLTGATITAGFQGWEEALPAGAGVN